MKRKKAGLILIIGFFPLTMMFGKEETTFIVGLDKTGEGELPFPITWQDRATGVALVRVPTRLRWAAKPLEEIKGVRYAFADSVIPLNALPPVAAAEGEFTPLKQSTTTGFFDDFRGQVAKEELTPVHVVVVDSGVNALHPLLMGRVSASLSQAFTDDPDPLEDAPALPALYGHGTYVALTVLNIAPNAVIISYRIFEPIDDGQGGFYLGARLSSIVRAFAAIRELAARNPYMKIVVNCSFVYWDIPAMVKPMLEIVGAMHRVPIVSAAGNEGRPVFNNRYPCSLPLSNVTCVTSSTEYNTLSIFANYGEEVAIAAVGEFIRLPDPTGRLLVFFGTSFSTPKVAGVKAVLLGMTSVVTPTAEQLKTALVVGGTTVPSLQHKAGSKVLNPAGAVAVYRSIASGKTLPPLAWWRFASALDTFEEERDELRKFSPGDIIIVSGHGFCTETRHASGWPEPSLPLPTELCGTRAILNNGWPIGILWATAGAIAFQLPFNNFILWPENRISIEKVNINGTPEAFIDLPNFRVAARPFVYLNGDGTAYTEINGPPNAKIAKLYVSGLGWWTKPAVDSDVVVPLEPLAVTVDKIPVLAILRQTPFLGILALEFALPGGLPDRAFTTVSIAAGQGPATIVAVRLQ